jgi:hypothetical protein
MDRKYEKYVNNLSQNLKGRDQLEDRGIGERIILKRAITIKDFRMWTGLN